MYVLHVRKNKAIFSHFGVQIKNTATLALLGTMVTATHLAPPPPERGRCPDGELSLTY